MFSYRKLVAIVLSAVALTAVAQSKKIEGVGRTATANEVAAWDIDVRPDFKGLPKGAGSVAQGEKLWVSQCASCHGEFGENNSVFAPLAGYTTKKDSEAGRVAALNADSTAPSRTTMMKVSHLSTLWDYINRAMPWTAPKSLTANEVYAVTAYLLNLGNVVPDDFTLSDKNMAETQKKMPNRNGMMTQHAMWPGKEFGGIAKPDTQGSNCMTNCATEAKVASLLPEHVRNAHGNLAEQTRGFGPSVGADTTKPAAGSGAEAKKSVAAPTAPTAPAAKASDKAVEVSGPLKSADVSAILSKNTCSACHGIDNKIIGPSFKDIATKQGGKADAVAYLTGKIKSGGSGVYGSMPMPAQGINDADAKKVATWISQGAAK
jgi:cytochrome c